MPYWDMSIFLARSSSEGRVRLLYISAWGFLALLVLTGLGNARAFRSWDEQQAQIPTSFLYMYSDKR